MIAFHIINMVIYPRGSYIVIHVAVSGVATPDNKKIVGAVIGKQENEHKVAKSVFREVLGRMQFTLHATRVSPHGASRLVQAMSPSLEKKKA